jgi:hypothetical protein
MDSWTGIKMFYKKVFNIPEKVLEYVAIFKILTDCVVGYSNYKIATRNKVEIEYVMEVIFDFFSFGGWKHDLDISPLSVYNMVNGIFIAYESYIKSISTMSEENLIISFNICRIYKEIKRLIERYYENS